MLRIELLPDYIGDKNKRLRLYIGWGIGIAVAVVGLMAMANTAGRENAAAKADRADKENLESITVAHKAEIAKEQSDRAQIELRQKFVLNSQLYNDGWPEAYETIRDVKPADNSIILDSMALDAAKRQTVSLTGFGSDEKAIVRWWMSLRNNTALFDHVNFDLVPHSFAPVGQASNNGGMGGMMGGGSGGRMGPMSPMGAGGSGGMGGKSPGQMVGMGGGGSGGMGMGGRGGGGSSAENGPGELAGRNGINFTASVVLRTALAGGIPTPTWPAGGGGGQSGFGGMGGSGGGMGGSGGGMGGPSSGGMKPGGA